MSAVQKTQFGFSKVTLLKDQALGRGSYGSVCKAKCDTLTCAAKIIHPLLFDLADPGARTMMRRFQQECELLAAIKHPNIVQYLGTHTDPATGLPVLLMELMDHSLTRFLETKAPLPLHTQVNFSLDVASALAYLHSNSILHRDLSSNNILLLGDRRAKVTDFGMSRLEKVSPRMTQATTCPGTKVYMPPEALNERPLHTDKLDTFSFGVVLIQIITGQFPAPSDRFTTLMVLDPSNKKHMIEAQVAVKEVERRQNHISLVQDSPLLGISLACLEDRHEDRPTASVLVTQLEALQALDAYQSSVEIAMGYRTECERLQRKTKQQEIVVEEIGKKFECLIKDKDYVIQEKDRMIMDKELAIRYMIEDKKHVIREKDRMMEDMQHVIQEKDRVIQEKDRIITAQETRLATSGGFSLRWKKARNAPVKFKNRGHTVVIGSKAYFYVNETAQIYEYDTDTESWHTLPPTPERITGCCVVSIYNLFLTFISPSGKLYTYTSGNGGERWVEKFPSMGTECYHPSCISTRDNVTVFSGIGQEHLLDLHTLEWRQIILNSFSYGDQIAFRFVDNGIVYKVANNFIYSCPENEVKDGNDIPWKRLSAMPHYYQTPISFNGHILALGGRTSYDYWKTGTEEPPKVKSIYRYDVESNSWAECGEMKVARSECMVAVVGNKMVVVGGEDSEEDTSRTDIAIAV